MKEKEIIEQKQVAEKEKIIKARRSVGLYYYALGVIIVLLLAGYISSFYIPTDKLFMKLSQQGHIFYWMLLAGFCAEMVAGSMGMGYGVICTTILLLLNIPPAVISSSVHSAESFTTAAGSISHWKLGNVNKKLTWILAVPAVIGAVCGATALVYFGEKYSHYVKVIIAFYSMYLGIRILMNAFKKDKKHLVQKPKRKVNIRLLGLIGGFIDSFGGGGWGPLVTGTFIRQGRTPRFVIGSSTVAKFILTIASAISFIFFIGIKHWLIVAGLLIGGVITAPFSAMITSRAPVKLMFKIVGSLIIVLSSVTIIRVIFF